MLGSTLFVNILTKLIWYFWRIWICFPYFKNAHKLFFFLLLWNWFLFHWYVNFECDLDNVIIHLTHRVTSRMSSTFDIAGTTSRASQLQTQVSKEDLLKTLGNQLNMDFSQYERWTRKTKVTRPPPPPKDGN